MIQGGLIGEEVITFDKSTKMEKGWGSTGWDFNGVALYTALFPVSAI